MSAKKNEPQKPKRISREAAANTVVAEMGDRSTLSELASKVDELVVAGGGNSKLAAAKDAVRTALRAAEALGVVRVSKPTDVIVERVKR